MMSHASEGLSFLIASFSFVILCICITHIFVIFFYILLLLAWLFLSSNIAIFADDLPSPCRPVHLLARSDSSTNSCLIIPHFSILYSVILSSFFLLHPFSTLSTLCVLLLITFPCLFTCFSITFLETCATPFLSEMFSFLILYLCITPHISFSPIYVSCRFVVAHAT